VRGGQPIGTVARGLGISDPTVHNWVEVEAGRTCRANAVTETLFGSLKVERLHDMRLAKRCQAQEEIVDWVTFHKGKRLPFTLG
jgi:hypothetical protein